MSLTRPTLEVARTNAGRHVGAALSAIALFAACGEDSSSVSPGPDGLGAEAGDSSGSGAPGSSGRSGGAGHAGSAGKSQEPAGGASGRTNQGGERTEGGAAGEHETGEPGNGGETAHAGADSGIGGHAGAGSSDGGTDAGAGAAGDGDSGGAAGAGDELGSGTVAVAYQIDAAHSGAQPNDRVRLPLRQRWAHDFGETGISYPLIADGLVFVTVGSDLFALQQSTGEIAWGPAALGGTGNWANAAYEAGRVFAVSEDGTVSAFAAENGNPVWQIQLPGNRTMHSAPVVLDGRIYTSHDTGLLYALRTVDGSTAWQKGVQNGWQAAAAVAPSGVFACYLCNNTYGFEPALGTLLWYSQGSCTGGGSGTTSVLADGRLYTRGPAGNWVFEAATGTKIDVFAAGPAPALSDGVLYAVNDGVLFASRAESGRPLWHFGDGSIVTAPIVVGSKVVIGSAYGNLFVVDRRTGKLSSDDRLPASIAPSNEKDEEAPLTGLGAANDLLIVAAGSTLYAY